MQVIATVTQVYDYTRSIEARNAVRASNGEKPMTDKEIENWVHWAVSVNMSQGDARMQDTAHRVDIVITEKP